MDVSGKKIPRIKTGMRFFWLFIIASVFFISIGVAYSVQGEYHDEIDNLLGQAESLSITIERSGYVKPISDDVDDVDPTSYNYFSELLKEFDTVEVGKINSIYLLGQRPDDSLYFYISSEDPEGDYGVELGMPYQEASDRAKGVFASRRADGFVENNQWGSWLVAAIPLYSKEESMVGVLAVVSSFDELKVDLFYRIVLPGLFAELVVVLLLVILKRLVDKQQQIIIQRSVFVTSTSHDVKSPLRGILWALELIDKPGVDKKELIKKMRVQLNYVIDLVESILASVRIDLEIDRFNKRRQDIVPIIENAIESQRLNAEQYNVKVNKQVPKELLMKIDGDLIRELVNNLLSNAIKYTRPNSKVEVSLKEEKKAVILSFSDEGEGLTAKEKEKLFDKFYRTDKAKASGKPGSGMGLSLVKDIVSQHRGTIKVTSSPGKGSVFSVKLPK